MTDFEKYRRPKLHVQFRLSRSHMKFLNQEKKRLRLQYGIRVSLAEIIQVLIEQHKMRMVQIATEDPDSVIWFYRQLVEKRNGKL